MIEFYKCMDCGAKGVKLWRIAACSCIELRCVDCGEKYCNKGLAPDKQGKFNREWDHINNRFYDGDQMYFGGSNILLAVPDPLPEAETFRLAEKADWWGYTSIPEEGVIWWKCLPLKEGDSPVVFNWEFAYHDAVEVAEMYKRYTDKWHLEADRLRNLLKQVFVYTRTSSHNVDPSTYYCSGCGCIISSTKETVQPHSEFCCIDQTRKELDRC